MLLQVIFVACLWSIVHSYEMGMTMPSSKAKTPHQFQEHDNKVCRQKDFLMIHTQVMTDSMCNKPRDTVVQLVPESDDIMYTPSAVVIKRCAGMCSTQLACLPAETKTVKVGIRRFKIGGGKTECGEVTLEEHVRCRCMCATMAEDCNKHQIYKDDECACHCTNMKDKAQCELDNKLWDQKDCKCYCKEEEQCSTGLSWVPAFCKCMKVSVNDL